MRAPSLVFADATTDYNVAMKFYSQQRWQLAADSCESFVKNHPIHEKAVLIHLYWGQSLVHLREFQSARAKFEEFIKNGGDAKDRPLALYRVGECSYFLGDVERAFTELTDFIKAYPDHELAERATVYLGEVQYRRGRPQEAAAVFDYYLKKYPAGTLKTDAEYSLARALDANGQKAEANQLYQKIAAEDNHPRAADALFNLAAGEFEQNRFADAARNFVKLTEEYPAHSLAPVAVLNAGFAYYQLQQFDQAIDQFLIAQKTADQADKATFWLGLSHKSLNNDAKAIEIFSQALAENPDQPLAESLRFQLATSQLRSGNLAQAISDFTQVFQTWPDGQYADDSVHSACEAAFRLGDLKQANSLNDLFQQRYATGGLRMVQQLLSGRVLIKQADESPPDSDQRRETLTKAIANLTDVVDSSSIKQTSHFAMFQIARAYERLGQDNEVVAILNKLFAEPVELDSATIRESRLLLANAYLREKSFDQAVAVYRQLITDAGSEEEKLNALTGLIAAATANTKWEVVREGLGLLENTDQQDLHYSQLATVAGDQAFAADDWQTAAEFFSLGAKNSTSNPHRINALSGQAHALFNLDKFEESATIFSELAVSAGEQLEVASRATYMQGTALRRAGKTDAALAAYMAGTDLFRGRDLATLRPLELENDYLLAKSAARAARELNQVDTANQQYQNAYTAMKAEPVADQGELDRLIFEWADLNYAAKNYARSDELYALLISERPDSDLADDAQLILAESQRFDGDLVAARSAFEKLLADPTADEFVRRRSLVHLTDLAAEAKDWGLSLKAARQLRAEFPNSEHRQYADFRIAEALVQTKQHTEATPVLLTLRQELAQDISEAPAWWSEVWVLFAAAALEQKQYDQLRAAIAELQEFDPQSKSLPRGELLVGQSYENQARFEEARAAYSNVINSDAGSGTPSAAEAQFRLAESYLKQDNPEAAYKEYYKVYVGYQAPEYQAAALNQAAKLDASQKKWRGAVLTYRTLINEFPESRFIPEAKQQLETILERFPEYKSDTN